MELGLSDQLHQLHQAALRASTPLKDSNGVPHPELCAPTLGGMTPHDFFVWIDAGYCGPACDPSHAYRCGACGHREYEKAETSLPTTCPKCGAGAKTKETVLLE